MWHAGRSQSPAILLTQRSLGIRCTLGTIARRCLARHPQMPGESGRRWRSSPVQLSPAQPVQPACSIAVVVVCGNYKGAGSPVPYSFN